MSFGRTAATRRAAPTCWSSHLDGRVGAREDREAAREAAREVAAALIQMH